MIQSFSLSERGTLGVNIKPEKYQQFPHNIYAHLKADA